GPGHRGRRLPGRGGRLRAPQPTPVAAGDAVDSADFSHHAERCPRRGTGPATRRGRLPAPPDRSGGTGCPGGGEVRTPTGAGDAAAAPPRYSVAEYLALPRGAHPGGRAVQPAWPAGLRRGTGSGRAPLDDGAA